MCLWQIKRIPNAPFQDVLVLHGQSRQSSSSFPGWLNWLKHSPSSATQVPQGYFEYSKIR